MGIEIGVPRDSARKSLHGPHPRNAGAVEFRLWAPACEHVEIEIDGQPARSMESRPEGWHEIVASAHPGTRYRFVLPDGTRIPDPASRFQPGDVHGASEVVDTESWQWTDRKWQGRPWHEAIIYELHVGTFTEAGTFRGVIDKLNHLVQTGITAIELMPIGDFRGRRNWGYDGVLPYAPDSAYGRPEDLKALVEAAHSRGLMVLLDVVYNHFGAEGNYLPLYAPPFFTGRHKTPWGAAINFDGEGSSAVREFVIRNAIYWIEQFHIDGLRLDAVHAIRDESQRHLLRELAERVRAAAPDRHIHLILENEENEAHWMEQGLITAQWNDDVHHVLHTAVTGEDQGYYREYHGDTARLGRALAEGFAFQGEMMHYRGSRRGEACGHLPPGAFVTFLQNHDQVGNRAFGDRVGSSASTKTVRAAAAVYLLLPQVPMLFMGEEWNASTPFPFFCDFSPMFAEAVRQGRREEFARFPEFQDPAQRERIPDPQSEETFASAKLRWHEIDEPAHGEMLAWYRRVLAVRRESIWPLVPQIAHGGRYRVLGDGAVEVRWAISDGRELVLATNLSDTPVPGVFPSARCIWQEGSIREGTLQPWTTVWWLHQPETNDLA